MSCFSTQFIFYNPDLTRIGTREVISASYSRRLNRVGSCTLFIDAKTNDFEVFSQEDLGLIIQASSDVGATFVDLDAFWLLVDFGYYGQDNDVFELGFVDALDILKRHRVPFFADNPRGVSPQARIDEPGNVGLRRIFEENIGSLALDRSLDPYLISAGISFPSPVVSKTIQFKNLLSAMNEVCKASAEKGTPLFFDIIARQSDQYGVQLEFKTFTDARGKDHTDPLLGDTRIRTSDSNFALEKFAIDFDRINYAYVAGAGRGINRPLVEVSNNRATSGIFSRREGYKSIQESDLSVLETEGFEMIDSTGLYSLRGELLGDLATKYSYGDKMRVAHEGLVIDSQINHVQVDVAGEVYTKNLRIESI